MRGGIVALAVSVAILAGMGLAESYSILDASRPSCQSFCSLANTNFHSISAGSCLCEASQATIDAQNNRMISWKTIIDAGNVKDLSIASPIPQDIVDQVNAQLAQQQILAQQRAAQGQ